MLIGYLGKWNSILPGWAGGWEVAQKVSSLGKCVSKAIYLAGSGTIQP